jgi:hypothetical protein
MAPGIYYIKSGNFNVNSATVNGTGVTIVLTKNTGNYATIGLYGGSTVSLTAPTSGATAGIVFFADRNMPTGTAVDFAGGSHMSFNGAVYIPSMTVSYSNGVTNSGACTQLIAWRLSLVGGANFQHNCDNAGIKPIGGSSSNPELVE